MPLCPLETVSELQILTTMRHERIACNSDPSRVLVINQPLLKLSNLEGEFLELVRNKNNFFNKITRYRARYVKIKYSSWYLELNFSFYIRKQLCTNALCAVGRNKNTKYHLSYNSMHSTTVHCFAIAAINHSGLQSPVGYLEYYLQCLGGWAA